jgi:hypothetical protein
MFNAPVEIHEKSRWCNIVLSSEFRDKKTPHEIKKETIGPRQASTFTSERGGNTPRLGENAVASPITPAVISGETGMIHSSRSIFIISILCCPALRARQSIQLMD